VRKNKKTFTKNKKTELQKTEVLSIL